MPRCKEERPSDFSQDTWLSLLELLRPSEYFVTIDHFPIWRRHLAWAKTDGDDLQKHTTQQFSTNMVFMSLLLGAELNVLFNSSSLTTEMRKSMQNEEYSELKFWIGVVILVSVFVTITALVGTFTAWRMVSAVSDTNAHCILRSSIGQYVTHLPSRLIVAALYSFLLWMMLFLIDMLSGPLCFVLFTMIALLFTQLIISYSAFGRLIIHTGAMGRKQILDPELERSLLPSGLHASLLIKATSQLHRRTSVTTQYRRPMVRKTDSNRSNNSRRRQLSPSPAPSRRGKECLGPIEIMHESGILTPDDEDLIMRAAETLSGRSSQSDSGNFHPDAPTPSPTSARISLDETLQFSASCETADESDDMSLELDDLNRHGTKVDREEEERKSDTSDVTNDWTNNGDTPASYQRKNENRPSRAMLSSRRPLNRRQSVKLKEEWQNDSDARLLYGIPPPIPPDFSSDEESEETPLYMPRASVLNRTKNMKSLKNLTKETITRSTSMPETNKASGSDRSLKRADTSFGSATSGFFTPVANMINKMSERNFSPPTTADTAFSRTDSARSNRSNSSQSRRVNFAPPRNSSERQSLLSSSNHQTQYDSSGGMV